MHRSTPYKYTHLTSLGYLTEWQKNITDGHTVAVGARGGKVTHTRMHTRPHAHTHTKQSCVPSSSSNEFPANLRGGSDDNKHRNHYLGF